MQHAPGPAPAGATLGVTADSPLVIQKVNRLLEHRFREPQLGMSIAEVMHQSRWVAVVIEQAFENPAHRQFQTQVLNRGLIKKSANGLEAG